MIGTCYDFNWRHHQDIIGRNLLRLSIIGTILVSCCWSQVVYEDGKNHRHLDLQQQSHCSGDWEFSCKDGRNCIARYDVCDGIEQCPDGSDEENCQHRYERPNQNNFAEQQHQNQKAMNRPVGLSSNKHAASNSQQQNQPPTNKKQLSHRRLPMEFLLLGASVFVIVAVIVHIMVKLKRRGCMTRRGGAAVRGFRKGESLIDDEDDLLISQAYS